MFAKFEGKKSSAFHLPHNSLRKRIIHMTSSCGQSTNYSLLSEIKKIFLSSVSLISHLIHYTEIFHGWYTNEYKWFRTGTVPDSFSSSFFLLPVYLFLFSPLSFIHFYLRWTYSKMETGLFCLLNPIWMTVHYFSTHCSIRSLTYLHFGNKSTFSPTQ